MGKEATKAHPDTRRENCGWKIPASFNLFSFFCSTFSPCSARSLHSFHLHCVYVGKVSENPQNIFQKSLLSHFLHDAHKHPEMRGQMSFLSEVQSNNTHTIHCNFMKMRILLCQQHVYVVRKEALPASFNEMRVISSEMRIRKFHALQRKIINFHKTWKILFSFSVI